MKQQGEKRQIYSKHCWDYDKMGHGFLMVGTIKFCGGGGTLEEDWL